MVFAKQMLTNERNIQHWIARMSRIAHRKHHRNVVHFTVLIILLWVAWKMMVTSRTVTFKVSSDLGLSMPLLKSFSPNYQRNRQSFSTARVIYVQTRPEKGLSKQVTPALTNKQRGNYYDDNLRSVRVKLRDSKQHVRSSRDISWFHSGRKTGSTVKPGVTYSTEVIKSSVDSPGNHLDFRRFDVIFKLVYAYYYSKYNAVPEIFAHAYKEHLRVWSNFRESCSSPHSFDSRCKAKNGENDFISSFQNTVNSIKEIGFQSNMSRIPTDKNGVILNGAHRLAAAAVLSKNATFEYFNTLTRNRWDYLFFEERGLQRNISDLVMLEWLKLQLQLPQIDRKVFTLAVFANTRDKDDRVRQIVSQHCAIDNGILYEKSLSLNKFGMDQLHRHMYGNQTWLPNLITLRFRLFKEPEFMVKFIFFFGKSINEIKACKDKIRMLYRYRNFKSSVHGPYSTEETYILGQMVLNPNSVWFLNYGKNGRECHRVATEIAQRSSQKPIPKLPGLYIGREDIMIDSGSAMHLFNVSNHTDVDVLFLHDIDGRILGTRNGLRIESQTFKTDENGPGGGWAAYHFNETVKSIWDLFYDPRNFGYCYGIKFVTLGQPIK